MFLTRSCTNSSKSILNFPRTDVAVVIGANDVVNPDARDNPASPIAGMPILEVDRAKSVVVLKRGQGKGFLRPGESAILQTRDGNALRRREGYADEIGRRGAARVIGARASRPHTRRRRVDLFALCERSMRTGRPRSNQSNFANLGSSRNPARFGSCSNSGLIFVSQRN